LFADGSVSGPNRWGIDLHYDLRRAIFAGEHVLAREATYEQAGDSITYAQMWARQYKRRTGLDATINTYRGPPAVTPDNGLSYIILGTWQTQGFLNGVLDVAGYQNCDEAQASIPFPSSCLCNGQAQCTQPNPEIPGKTFVRVSEYAFSTCPGASIVTLALLSNAPPLGSGLELYYVAYAEGTITFPDNTVLDRYSIDSCVTNPSSSGVAISKTCSN
ncbi:MAG: hypothetical protein KGL39_41275, partial [Patescibacteria group bacterium]|nr:hypothetical protein [Patescibacteria group bacterium]